MKLRALACLVAFPLLTGCGSEVEGPPLGTAQDGLETLRIEESVSWDAESSCSFVFAIEGQWELHRARLTADEGVAEARALISNGQPERCDGEDALPLIELGEGEVELEPRLRLEQGDVLVLSVVREPCSEPNCGYTSVAAHFELDHRIIEE